MKYNKFCDDETGLKQYIRKLSTGNYDTRKDVIHLMRGYKISEKFTSVIKKTHKNLSLLVITLREIFSTYPVSTSALVSVRIFLKTYRLQ